MITLPSGLTVECDAEQVSDGYHTFGELYAHRCILFAALCHAHEPLAWKSLGGNRTLPTRRPRQ